MKKTYKKLILIALLLIIGFSICYNVVINNRVKVVEQTIEVDNLPEEFEGFTILQISDLHNKRFGNNQEDLIKIINSLNYDIIGICGDMKNLGEDDNSAFIDLLKGIENKENVFYTPGNHGPFVYEDVTEFKSVVFTFKPAKNDKSKLTEEGKLLQDLGVKFLDEAYSIKRGDKTLWITELLYLNDLKEITNNKYKDGDINIAITHYPMSKNSYEGNGSERLAQYDLVLAGHYHGGQWRVPFFGAVFIPDLNQSGLFPSKERVSGLTTWGGVNQYVTKGLGAGNEIMGLKFRLFNQPEINLIKLTKRN